MASITNVESTPQFTIKLRGPAMPRTYRHNNNNNRRSRRNSDANATANTNSIDNTTRTNRAKLTGRGRNSSSRQLMSLQSTAVTKDVDLTASVIVDESAIYSRKVHVSRIPRDIPKTDLFMIMAQFGSCHIQLLTTSATTSEARARGLISHVSNSKAKGYGYVIYEEEQSVHKLLERCRTVGTDHVLNVELWPSGGTGDESFTSSFSIKPWLLSNKEYVKSSGTSSTPVQSPYVLLITNLHRGVTAKDLFIDFHRFFASVTRTMLYTDAYGASNGIARVHLSDKVEYDRAIGEFDVANLYVHKKKAIVLSTVAAECC